jgi:hypothetical protein
MLNTAVLMVSTAQEKRVGGIYFIVSNLSTVVKGRLTS